MKNCPQGRGKMAHTKHVYIRSGSAYLMTTASKQSNGMYYDEYEQASGMRNMMKCVRWLI